MKKYIVTVLAIILLFSVSGCSDKVLDVERVTMQYYAPYPEYRVLVITPDGAVKDYDFTSQWISNNFNFFTDLLPSEDEYSVREWRLAEGDWTRIVQALEENHFLELPEEVDTVDAYDFPSYYIEVEVNGVTHGSGGYVASEGASKSSQRLQEVFGTIYECIKEIAEY